MKKRTFIIIIVILVLVGVFFLLILPKIKKGKKEKYQESPEEQKEVNIKRQKAGKPKIVWTNDNFPLKIGSKGQKVTEWQEFLGLTGKAADGLFGGGTETLTKKKLGKNTVSKAEFDKYSIGMVKRKDTFPLTLGATGWNVVGLQGYLKKIGVYTGDVTGVYNNKTLVATKKAFGGASRITEGNFEAYGMDKITRYDVNFFDRYKTQWV